jgi:hypothetical protein
MTEPDHTLADPRRSCRDEGGVPGQGGVWHTPRDTETSNLWWKIDYKQEMDRFPKVVRAMLGRELWDRLDRAERGDLTFGAESHHDVGPVATQKMLLELRAGHHWGDEPQAKLYVRVYFNEPAAEDKTLKLLRLACKHDFPQGKIEQNRHMAEARDRLKQCSFEPLAA